MAAVTTGRGEGRLRRRPLARRLSGQPALGTAAGCVLVFPLLAVAASGTGMFSARRRDLPRGPGPLGIVAVAAALSMIGGASALSVGSMIGLAGVAIAVPAIVRPAPALDPARLPGRGRFRERTDRHPNRPAVLHRDARRPAHPARARHRASPDGSPAAPQ